MATPDDPKFKLAASKPAGQQGTRKKGPLRVIEAKFVASVAGPSEVPSGLAEIALCGRSNVGKSSLINALCNRNGLARTSRTPGRTQRVNLFDVTLSTGESVRLVDLPGFGHAVVPRAIRDSFGPMIQDYLIKQPTLFAVILLHDARRDRDEDAIGFAEWLRDHGKGVFVVATKVDKLPKTERFTAQKRLQRDYRLPREPVMTSADTGDGIEEMLLLLRAIGQPMVRK
jgi:GTP-binding protein